MCKNEGSGLSMVSVISFRNIQDMAITALCILRTVNFFSKGHTSHHHKSSIKISYHGGKVV